MRYFFDIVTWEQRKLGDIANSFEYGLNVAAKKFDGKNKYIRITDIDDSTHAFLKDNLTSPNSNLDKIKNYQLKDGDILFTRTGASVGKTYIYEQNDGTVFYAGFLIRANICTNYDPEFIFQNTLTERYDNYIKIISQRSGQPGVNAKEYAEYTLMCPSLLEQKRISSILKRVDELIILQQRKLSLIEKLRENISEHIFSPDIMKFKNIDPEFEIKKLSDISNIFIGLVTTMTKNYAKNGILLIRNSNIKENNFKFDNYIYLDSKFAEKNKNREMKIGDVVTVHTGDIGTSAVIEPKEENSIGFATITTRPNNKIINSYYLSDYLNTKKHKNWAVRMSTGDGRRNYNLKDFTRIRLNVPSLNYQIKIVALIKYLESFSKSEKKKINQLNSLKQFLLQNLFI